MKKQLLILPFWAYNPALIKMTGQKAKENDRICYVTLNKTFRSLETSLEKSNIDVEKFYFIDMITPKLLKYDSEGRCQFLEDIDDLDEFADILLTTAKMKKATLVIFDSASSFLVYKSEEEVLDFFNYIIPMLEKLHIDLTITALTEDAERPVLRQLEMVVDKTEMVEK